MRASERQRASGQKRPAWPGNAVAVTATLRQPQQQRSRATRQALLDAAIASLAELGWNGTTVAVVAERAGVSRGAAQHHFPTRESLFTAAIDELMGAWIADIRAQR